MAAGAWEWDDFSLFVVSFNSLALIGVQVGFLVWLLWNGSGSVVDGWDLHFQFGGWFRVRNKF